MELGVRDWLVIIGVLLIAVVLVDGLRRMRNDRRGKIRMSLNKNFINSTGDVEELTSTELLGGPRVVARAKAAKNSVHNDDLQLDEAVPMLMESISAADAFGNAGQSDEVKVQPLEPVDDEDEVDCLDNQPAEFTSVSTHESNGSERKLKYVNQEVIVINVMAKKEPFRGTDLLHILLACDCRFGEMNIFHRFENASGKGPIQFSIVNSVEPGSFNLDDIDHFTTPGVCFFVTVPGPDNAMQAFDYMVETCQCLVKNLNGELRDESHSVMTAQTLEHCRQKIREIERRQLTRA